MRFAVIGDIHSNLFALTSVIADIDEKSLDCIFCTGDITGYSPFPNEVIDLLKRRGVVSIKGNYDDAIGNRELLCGCGFTDPGLLALAARSVSFTNKTISDSNREYLSGLPEYLKFKVLDHSFLIVHGSPRLINEGLHEDSRALRDALSRIEENVLICGHTHVPFVKWIGKSCVINAGTVGKPVSRDPRATYALIDTHSELHAEIVYVSYDVHAASKAILDCDGLPAEFAAMILTGNPKVALD